MLLNLYGALLVILSFAMLATAVPIFTDGIQSKPLNDKYFLSIWSPDGTVRQETVQQIAPGLLQVNVVLKQPFNDQEGNVVVSYVAGPNGYVAKYSYIFPRPPPVTTPPSFLDPQALKSVAG